MSTCQGQLGAGSDQAFPAPAPQEASTPSRAVQVHSPQLDTCAHPMAYTGLTPDSQCWGRRAGRRSAPGCASGPHSHPGQCRPTRAHVAASCPPGIAPTTTQPPPPLSKCFHTPHPIGLVHFLRAGSALWTLGRVPLLLLPGRDPKAFPYDRQIRD